MLGLYLDLDTLITGHTCVSMLRKEKNHITKGIVQCHDKNKVKKQQQNNKANIKILHFPNRKLKLGPLAPQANTLPLGQSQQISIEI